MGERAMLRLEDETGENVRERRMSLAAARLLS